MIGKDQLGMLVSILVGRKMRFFVAAGVGARETEKGGLLYDNLTTS